MPTDFLFDIGNVILKFDFSIAMERLCARSSRTGPAPLEAIEKAKIELESGRVEGAEFVSHAIELLRFEGSEAEFTRIWCEIFELNAPVADLIRDLADSGARLHLFSNTSGIHRDYFIRNYPVFDYFPDGIFSYAIRSMKPDEGMYLEAIKCFNLSPEETIYLDDNVENIATGKRLGLRAIPYDYNRHEDLLPRLAEAGVKM